MENKEYLSEERYQQTNAKVKKVGKILLIIGILISVLGLVFLIVGFVGTGKAPMEAGGVESAASKVFGNIGLFAIGGLILTVGPILAFAGGITMFMAHRREITAYASQQVMPIAQEGIQKMAPTVGSAMGTIGKEIAKGIKEGINEADEGKNK